MTPQEALEIKRAIRFGLFRDMVSRVAGIGVGLTLVFGIFFCAIFLFDALSEFDYAEYRREQKLMECLKEAGSSSASYCQLNWGPWSRSRGPCTP